LARGHRGPSLPKAKHPPGLPGTFKLQPGNTFLGTGRFAAGAGAALRAQGRCGCAAGRGCLRRNSC